MANTRLGGAAVSVSAQSMPVPGLAAKFKGIIRREIGNVFLGVRYFLSEARSNKLNLLMLIIEPVGLFLIYYALLYALLGTRSADLIWHFLAGIFVFLSMREVANQVAGARNRGLGVMSVSPVRLSRVLRVRIVVGVVRASIQVATVCVLLAFFGKLQLSWWLPLALLGAWTLGGSFGLIFLSLLAWSADYMVVKNMAFRCFFYISGILFSSATIPAALEPYLNFNPFLVLIAKAREGILGDPGFTVTLQWVPAWIAVFVVVAAVLLRASRMRLRNTR